jgi:[ribosomal protein S5]-alanine N-acetyltransferase
MAATTEQSNEASAAAASGGVATSTPARNKPLIRYGNVIVRRHSLDDAPALARLANNIKVAQYLRDRFPHPYRLEDAVEWLSKTTTKSTDLVFAICKLDGTYVGNIGLLPLTDVERITYEIGYWLGEEFWGQGIMTDALTCFSKYAFEAHPELLRLEAGAFGPNIGSQRVLAKAGYTLEGRRRRAAIKNGQVIDLVMYGLLREECLKSE